MRSPSSNFTTEAAESSNTPIHLIQVYISTTETLYFALWDVDVEFDGITYAATRGTFSPLAGNIELQAPTLQIEVNNIDSAWVSYIANNNIQGKKVTFITVFEDQLADTDAFVSDSYFIGSYAVNRATASFELGSIVNVFGATVPRRQYGQFFCPWRYRDPDTCGYNIKSGELVYLEVGGKTVAHTGLATCDKSFDGANGCTKHFVGMPKRFGAFPTRIRQAISSS